MFLWAKYNTQTAFRFPMVKRGVVDLAVTGDWTPATGDTKVSKDGGNFANTTNNPSATGGTGSVGWTLTLTATELSAAEVNIQIVDSATKAVEDQWLTIYTYGNASAKIQPDLSDVVRMGLTALPNAAAAASGGLPILGANATAISFTAGMTISNAGGDALALSSSGSNGSGLATSGNGTGAGIKATAGATGNGIQSIGGATSGSAIKATGTAGNAIALELAGQGSAAGLSATGGATGPGMKAVGGGTSGDGFDITTTAGDGLAITPTAGSAIVATANGTSKHGIFATGGTAGTSDGVKMAAGTGGVDLRANQTGNIVGTVSTLTTYTGNTPQTGDAFARLGAPAGVSVSADVASVKADSAAIKTDVETTGVKLTAGDSPVLQSGTAAAGGASTITIASAIGADSRPAGCIIKITGGTGSGQARGIVTYVDATKVVTVDRAWTTNPDATSVYSILYAEVPKLDANLKVAGVVLADTVTTYTGNTVQTGDAYARLGTPAGASVSADIATVKSDTGAVLGQTGTTGVVVAAASKTGYRMSATGVGDILTTALTESYAAQGAAGTLTQIMFWIQQMITELSISSTTGTVKKLDGATTAGTITLNDATNPTSKTRAT